MKKLILLFSAVLLIAVGLAGCAANGQVEFKPGLKSNDIYADLPEFYFGPGVGASVTSLTIKPNGTFTGYYADSDMGVTGPGYPNGTLYECDFSGKFSGVKRIGEFEYSATVESIDYKKSVGEEYIEDGVLVIPSEPYGLENAGECRLYLPGMPTKDLPPEFLDWVRWDGMTGTLPFYGIYSIEDKTGFAGYLPPEEEGIPGLLTEETGSIADYAGWWKLEGDSEAPFAYIEIAPEHADDTRCYSESGELVDFGYADYSEQRRLNGKSLIVFVLDDLGDLTVAGEGSDDSGRWLIVDFGDDWATFYYWDTPPDFHENT